MSTSALLSGDSGHVVELRGHPVKADVGVVRRLMADLGVAPEEQPGLWLALWRQWPDSEWGERCLAEAERVSALLEREAVLAQTAHVATADKAAGRQSRKSECGPLAERHFVWLGDKKGLRVEHLRDAIAGLARIGMIRSDRGQQDALRRGLGLALNDVERGSDAPWVDWLGPADMLALLVDRLWAMGLVTCVGGRGQKWRTATGMFRRGDGTRYDLTLRNSRCTDAAKLELMEKNVLGGLRFFIGDC